MGAYSARWPVDERGRRLMQSGWLSRSDTYMVAGRRFLAEKMSQYKSVYSYEFAQPPDNFTIDIGYVSFRVDHSSVQRERN